MARKELLKLELRHKDITFQEEALMSTSYLKKLPYILVLIAFACLSLGACASARSPSSEAPVAPASDYYANNKVAVQGAAREKGPGASGAPVPPALGAPAGGTTDSASAQADQRLVIKNANLTLVVGDPAKSVTNISKLADSLGGFVVSANVYQEQLDNGVKVPRASVTIRVPAEKLNDALASIRSESDQDPLSENQTSQDITSEYTDLQSRLRNLEAAEAQLQKIMDSAIKTEDVLNVYNQLVQTREQIEVIKGQMKYYEQSAAMSAISAELIANAAVQPLTVGGWQPGGVAKSAIQALINTLKFFANAAIWAIIFLVPVLLVLFVIVYLPLRWIWRGWRRRRDQQKPSVVVTQPPEGQ
jgi:hypothetical protein